MSGPVIADLTNTVVHSSKLLINDVKSDHSLTQYINNTNDLTILFCRRQQYVGEVK